MATIKRKFKGVWIPKEIWLSEKLSMQEKIFLVEIDSLDNDDCGCYASNKYFSNFFNLSENLCSEVISSLAKKGFIKVVVKKHSGRSERCIISYAPTTGKGGVGIADPLPEKEECPLPEKRVPNNTEENNITLSEDRKSAIAKIPFFDDSESQDKTLDFLVSKGIPKDIAARELSKFIAYWTEPDARGKPRWKAQKFFEIKRRLATWFSRITNEKNNRQTGMVL